MSTLYKGKTRSEVVRESVKKLGMSATFAEITKYAAKEYDCHSIVQQMWYNIRSELKRELVAGTPASNRPPKPSKPETVDIMPATQTKEVKKVDLVVDLIKDGKTRTNPKVMEEIKQLHKVEVSNETVKRAKSLVNGPKKVAKPVVKPIVHVAAVPKPKSLLPTEITEYFQKLIKVQNLAKEVGGLEKVKELAGQLQEMNATMKLLAD